MLWTSYVKVTKNGKSLTCPDSNKSNPLGDLLDRVMSLESPFHVFFPSKLHIMSNSSLSLVLSVLKAVIDSVGGSSGDGGGPNRGSPVMEACLVFDIEPHHVRQPSWTTRNQSITKTTTRQLCTKKLSEVGRRIGKMVNSFQQVTNEEAILKELVKRTKENEAAKLDSFNVNLSDFGSQESK
ncbi:hypothetical protein L1887_12396 [Cichorium endivia]|nr:hypothetical protein L1887_12396 [Cichorium endivia]